MASKEILNEPTFISKDVMKRIISDIKEIKKNPLTAHGIYYEHHDTEFLKGMALIIGPAGTPYADGFYLFKIKFPTNYPHAPPVVDFFTQDGITRFNPNLYRSGKVCLSILNTWKGEQWSACQTLSSVLLALCTILNDTPLLNEPGLTEQHSDFNRYNKIITYKNIETAFLGVIKNERLKMDFAPLWPVIEEHFQKKKEDVRKRVEGLLLAASPKSPTSPTSPNNTSEIISTGVYQMTIRLDYKAILERLV